VISLKGGCRDGGRRQAGATCISLLIINGAASFAYSAVLPHILLPRAPDRDSGFIFNDSGNGLGPTSTITTFGGLDDSGLGRIGRPCPSWRIGEKPFAATIPLSFDCVEKLAK
jgi:hypothetical protein